MDNVFRRTLRTLAYTVVGCVITAFFVSCTPETQIQITEEPTIENTIQTTASQNTEAEEDPGFQIDLTKISPMIMENVSEDVIVAAKTVIEGFLQYDNSVEIAISGNSYRFLNDMAYVIHCTCPMFGAFTDFNEISSYDESTGKVSWEFLVDQGEFDRKMQAFYEVTETYLADIKTTDSEAMRAMLLYYSVIRDLRYDYDLIGENYEKLSKKEANLKSSPYYVLVEKSGICTNIAQAYMFLCTQADITCGTVLHMGGSGMHM